jgi:hypothetical protein
MEGLEIPGGRLGGQVDTRASTKVAAMVAAVNCARGTAAGPYSFWLNLARLWSCPWLGFFEETSPIF